MLLTKYKDDIQLIERFFERELTEQELADFEARLKVDNNFAERVERFGYAHKQVEQLYYPNEREAFKQNWTNILDAEEEAPPQKVRTLRHYALRVAAAILLILGLMVVINQFSPANPSYQQIALATWEQSEADMNVGVRGGEQVVDSAVIWDKAEKAYKDDKFLEAIELLGLLGDNPDALFWKGRCYFELRQIPEAISHFDAVIQHKDGGKKDLALWGQALAYLYDDNVDSARKNLNIIIDNKYPKARDAKRLLEEL